MKWTNLKQFEWNYSFSFFLKLFANLCFFARQIDIDGRKKINKKKNAQFRRNKMFGNTTRLCLSVVADILFA